jgi:hypothetical protein
MAGGASGQQRAAWSERRRGEDVDAFEDWQNKSLAEILKAPVSALQGVSEDDADLLNQAFNIKTVSDLGNNRYFRAAQLLAQLTEAGAK